MAAARKALADKKRPLPWRHPHLSRVERIIKFLEFLPITKGLLAGKRMVLLDNQRQFIQDVYGSERVRIAVKSEPRGNGKTGLIAGLCLCHLLGPEAEERGEVYSAAIDREQAGLMFNEMEAIILRVPEFAVQVNIQRFVKRIEVLSGTGIGSIYAALSADARRAHGLSPTLWVYDELAQAKNRELLDNLMTAMGKRKNSLGMVISTQARNDDHALSQLIDDGLSGVDKSMVVHLSAVPEDADIFDMEVIRRYNPALGSFLDEFEVRKALERAQRLPSEEGAFRNLRGNQRVDANEDERIVPASIWRLGVAAPQIVRHRLPKRRAFAGLDLSGTDDLTALVLALPDNEKDRGFDILPFFWTPEARIDLRPPAERDIFRQWVREGKMTAIQGPVIKYSFIAHKLQELNDEFDLDVGFDRWGMKFLKPELDEIKCNVRMEPFGQGFQDMSPALSYFIELALTGRLRHGAHPVLSACVANAIVVSDAAGNKKIDKGRSNQRATTRIDGAVALTMALGLARGKMSIKKGADLSAFLKAPVAA